MEIGLFFGSFNPIHTGHMIIANLVKETTLAKEIWFVVTPSNPLKKNKNLLHGFDRLDLVTAAIADEYSFRACDIEFDMSRPSYTIDTLIRLQERHPDKKFQLIIGEDNLVNFPSWKNYQQILKYFKLIVYPRPDTPFSDLRNHKNVCYIEAPKLDISASLIRKLIRNKKSIRFLVPEVVELNIRSKGFFL